MHCVLTCTFIHHLLLATHTRTLRFVTTHRSAAKHAMEKTSREECPLVFTQFRKCLLPYFYALCGADKELGFSQYPTYDWPTGYFVRLGLDRELFLKLRASVKELRNNIASEREPSRYVQDGLGPIQAINERLVNDLLVKSSAMILISDEG